jgi:dimethylglycine dehydrogenase
MQSQARVVVIGGGAVGASALYHLTRLGWHDVVLLERDELTAGSTWHAAGNCPNFATAWSVLRLQHASTELYARLAREVGYDINYHVTGSIRLAHSRDRVDEFRHVLAQGRAQGIEFELLTPQQIRARHPFLELHELRAGLWDPTDGDIDPAQLTQALAKGARDAGAQIYRHTRVTGLKALDGGWRIETTRGAIEAEYVINAAGYRGGEIALLAGQSLPIVTLAHQYLLTEDIPQLSARGEARLPLVRDPDVSYYLRQERHGLLLGPYESAPRAHWLDGLPDEFAHQLFNDDLGPLEPYIEDACRRVPILASVGVRRVINGPIPYAPDGNPLMGPAAGLRNFFHCCAFTFGIVQAGGAGRLIASWVVHGEPEWDIWPFDVRRHPSFVGRAYVLARALETYRHEYGIAYPQEERPAGRPAKASALYGYFTERGAPFGARGGWERALYYPRSGESPHAAASFRRPSWHGIVERECRQVGNDVAVMDLPGLTTFEVAGAGAAGWLDQLIAGELPTTGRVRLAYCCSPRGGIVSEMTVARLADNRFRLMSAAAAERHDEDWLRGHLPPGGAIRVTNVSGRDACLVIAGPKARELLARVTDADLSNASFPWCAAREIRLGQRRVLALRLNYVGELGWELHVAAAELVEIHARLLQASGGALSYFGLYAQESLRLEKCYRSWKADLTGDHSPLAASLERYVALDKRCGFIGQEALQREAAAGPRERLVPLTLDAAGADAAPGAVVHLGDEIAGLVTSGGYGYRIRQSIALAYVRADLSRAGTPLEVEILGERVPAHVAEEPLYDRQNLRPRA